MGRESRARAASGAPPVVHRRKLFGGRTTAEEVHARYAFPPGSRCAGCGRPPQVRAVVMLPLDEVRKRDPDFDTLAELALVHPGAAEKFHGMLVMLRGGDGQPAPHVRMTTAYACRACTPAMERVLARGPSWAVVEINRGPGPDRPVVGVL